MRTRRRAVVLLAFKWGWQTRQGPKQEGGREEAGFGQVHVPRSLLGVGSPNIKISKKSSPDWHQGSVRGRGGGEAGSTEKLQPGLEALLTPRQVTGLRATQS